MQKAKPIITVLRVLISSVYYLLALFTLLLLILDISNIVTKSDHFSDNLNFNVMAFGQQEVQPHYTYLADSSIRYQPSPGQYSLQTKPGTPLGYYAIIVKLIHSAFALLILWSFMKIFDELKLERPFNNRILRLLKQVAVLFIVSDLFTFVDYLVTNALLPGPGFKLQIQVGSGLITGLSVWVLAIVYQRGMTLQTENELTV